MKNLLIITLSILVSISLCGQTFKAYDIMQKNVQVTFSQYEIAQIKLILVTKNGNKKIRTFEQFSKIDNNGNRALSIKLLSPYFFEGISFLSIENSDRVSGQWFYFPPLNVLKYVPPAKQSQLIEGTDFSFEDLKMEEIESYHYIFLSDKYIDGALCYQIKSLPKTNKLKIESGYSKRILFIDKQNYVLRKALLYDKSGNLLKEYRATDIRKIGDVHRAFNKKMTNLSKSHSTILMYTDLILTNELAQKYFTLSYIKSEINM